MQVNAATGYRVVIISILGTLQGSRLYGGRPEETFEEQLNNTGRHRFLWRENQAKVARYVGRCGDVFCVLKKKKRFAFWPRFGCKMCLLYRSILLLLFASKKHWGGEHRNRKLLLWRGLSLSKVLGLFLVRNLGAGFWYLLFVQNSVKFGRHVFLRH